ncbi:hypothetical protein BH10ACT11_BH10ACT11_00260 [soil metagenome]
MLESSVSRLAARDHLVDCLLTQPAFRAQLEVDVQRSSRHASSLSVALIDLDDFKYLNAKHGFATGDAILVAAGVLLDRNTRTYDPVCRAGADEFAILMPETEASVAKVVVDRLLVDLESAEVNGVKGISASAGIATLKPGHDANGLFMDAFEACRSAHESGGGRAVVSSAVPGSAAQPVPRGADADVVIALAHALEERDRYTGEHSETVVDLTARVGEALGLDSAEVDELKTAALLHDIGKVGIPDAILHKPGPLDEREWEIMRQHPAIGERILRAIPGMGTIARVVRHEHERWDGGGYPDRLIGEQIPLGARIILACDAYHAMVSDRPYRKAMPHRAAIAELTDNAGSQFDPKVVEALVGYLFGRRQAGLAAV